MLAMTGSDKIILTTTSALVTNNYNDKINNAKPGRFPAKILYLLHLQSSSVETAQLCWSIKLAGKNV